MARPLTMSFQFFSHRLYLTFNRRLSITAFVDPNRGHHSLHLIIKNRLVHLDLVTQSDSIVDSVITSLEPISDRLLENVVATELAQERAVLFRLEASDTTNHDSATEIDRSSDETTKTLAASSTDINSEAAEQEKAPSNTEVAEQASNEDIALDNREENNQNQTNGRTDSTVGATK